MTGRGDIEALKARVPMSELARRRGLGGVGILDGAMTCPHCRGAAHIEAGDRGYRCAGCGKSGDVLTAIRTLNRCGHGAGISALSEMADDIEAERTGRAAKQGSLL